MHAAAAGAAPVLGVNRTLNSTAGLPLAPGTDRVDRYPGEAPVYVEAVTSVGSKLLELGRKVQPIPDFFAEAKTLLGEAAVA